MFLLSLKLLIDEDSQATLLIRLLRNAGHDLMTISEAFLEGIDDEEVLRYASQNDRVVLTHNCKDFKRLHKISNNHRRVKRQIANRPRHLRFATLQ